MVEARTLGLLHRRSLIKSRSAVLRFALTREKMSTRKGRGRVSTPPSTKVGIRIAVNPADRAIPFRSGEESRPMDHSTPFSSRKGTLVLRPSVGLSEMARGQEVQR